MKWTSNQRYKYGIFRKNDNRPIVRTRDKEEAERLRKYNFVECEVRPL